jgi:simple sugar transport system substrate-binding protein
MTGILAAGLAFVGLTCGVALAADAPLKIIYVSHADSGNPFWLTVKKGMDDACALIKAGLARCCTTPARGYSEPVANMQSGHGAVADLIITSIPTTTP